MLKNYVSNLVDHTIEHHRQAFRKLGLTAKHEFYWPEDHCPSCGNQGRNIATISAWFYEEYETLIFYWLCPKCRDELLRTSRSWKFKLQARVEENTKASFAKHLEALP